MDVVSQASNGAPPSIAQSVVSVMTGQNTTGRKNRRSNSVMANPKKMYEEVRVFSFSRCYFSSFLL